MPNSGAKRLNAFCGAGGVDGCGGGGVIVALVVPAAAIVQETLLSCYS